MSKRKLYIFLAFACLAGYIWIAISLLFPENQIWSGCLFRQLLHIPCPACGSTRSVMALLNGDWQAALYLNPNGILLALLLVVIPLWLALDLLRRKFSLYHFYNRMEKTLKQKSIFFIFLGLVLINWFWNILKEL